MKIPLKAKVICKDGEYGSIKELLIDPVKEKATHVVVENKHNNLQVILPIEDVDYSSDTVINLDFTAGEIDKYPAFLVHEFVKVPNIDQDALYWGVDPVMTHTYTMFPYVMHEGNASVEVSREVIPKGEMKVKKGMTVLDNSGKKVGKIDEFIVERESEHITHIVMRTGHVFGKKEVAVPSISIEKYGDENINLTIDQEEINSLPEVVIKRTWE